MKKRNLFGKIARVLFAALVAVPVIYIMARHLGLAEELDFGAGAYYYADIPEFQKYVDSSAYVSKTPAWVLVCLFLAWGFLMYRLWVWLEGRK